MRHTSMQYFLPEGFFPNSSFKRIQASLIQLDSESSKGSGRSSPSRFNPLATLWSKNSTPMLRNRTKRRGNHTLTLQWRLDQQQEENRKSFEAINTRMDRMDDQLSFLCYLYQMANEQMLFPYQNTSRQFKEMEMQGIPVTMANLAIHRQREEEMNQERMRHNQIIQEATTQQAKETNKGKSREVVPDSEEEFVSSESEE
ncbi:hypothetical protein PIB30_102454 [Stylosanthes scabra]|uniref:Uncharacterized protein n=1 Tax=Stylosanthes scabra TaxID=79078 RepID=A0ABU6QYU8_9FABA|nr:hypothetical protein [Stylosanthes scabra]